MNLVLLSSLINMNKALIVKKTISIILVLLSIGAFLLISANLANIDLSFNQLLNSRIRFAQGFYLTIQISIFSMLVSLFIGTIVAIARQSHILSFFAI